MRASIAEDAGEFIVCMMENGKVEYNDRAKDALKAVDGRRWDGARKAWVYPATGASAATLSDVMEYLDFEIDGDKVFKKCLSRWDAGTEVLKGNYEPMPPCKTAPFKHRTLASV